jgi:N-carbamoylputrescine amidase
VGAVRVIRPDSRSWSPDLDVDQRRDWLELLPFLRTRRPDAYQLLVESRR